MQFSTTDYIAIYGAVVATFVLAWDIAKWLTSGARLRVHTRCNVCYDDARVIKVTQTESGEARELAEYCHVEITNAGDQPATILSIDATHKVKRGRSQMFYGGVQFIPHFGKTLPHVLSPGEVWSARFEMPLLNQLAERGKPIIRISTSKSKRFLLVWPKLEQAASISL
jgi:hypothetical protein